MQIGVDVARAVDNKRVFVVDSDEVIRAALTFMLQDENETHEIASLTQAWTKSAERRPDLILLGVGTLAEAGLDTVAELTTKLPGVKILLVAPSAQDEMAQRGLQCGAHGIVAKPFTIESVRRKVDRMLGRSVALGIPIEVR